MQAGLMGGHAARDMFAVKVQAPFATAKPK